MGKKKQKQTTVSNTNQTQQNTPFGPAIPGLTSLAGNINNAMNTVQGLPQYTGDFVAQPGQLQAAVIPAYQEAGALAGQLVDPALMAANTTNWQMPSFGGPAIEAGTQSFGSYDPSGVESVIQGAIAPYLRQLQEQVLPGLQSAGIESGAYSNDRALAVLPGQAIRDTGRMASEVASQVAFQDFLSQQQRQLEAFGLSTQRGMGEADVLTQRLAMFPELLDTAMRMQAGEADYAAQAASYDAAMRQAEINNALARDNYNVTAPFRGLDTAASLYGAFAPYGSQNMTGSSRSTTTQTQSGGTLGQIFQGALGLGSLALGIPGVGSALGGALGLGAATAANPLIMNPAALAGAGARAFGPIPSYPLWGG